MTKGGAEAGGGHAVVGGERPRGRSKRASAVKYNLVSQEFKSEIGLIARVFMSILMSTTFSGLFNMNASTMAYFFSIKSL